MLWSDWAYAQADLRLCWSHIPHCWKSNVVAHIDVGSKELSSLRRFRWVPTVHEYALVWKQGKCFYYASGGLINIFKCLISRTWLDINTNVGLFVIRRCVRVRYVFLWILSSMKKRENSSEKERYPIVAKLNKVLKCLQKTKQLYD